MGCRTRRYGPLSLPDRARPESPVMRSRAGARLRTKSLFRSAAEWYPQAVTGSRAFSTGAMDRERPFSTLLTHWTGSLRSGEIELWRSRFHRSRRPVVPLVDPAGLLLKEDDMTGAALAASNVTFVHFSPSSHGINT